MELPRKFSSYCGKQSKRRWCCAGRPQTRFAHRRKRRYSVFDVAVQKARTAIFFSAANGIFSGTLTGASCGLNASPFSILSSVLAQSLYPPGISGTQPGIFSGCRKDFPSSHRLPVQANNPVSGRNSPTSSQPDPNLPNGITIFSRRGFPALPQRRVDRRRRRQRRRRRPGRSDFRQRQVGVSRAHCSIRADQGAIPNNARLPFAKFPRNPGDR